MLPLQSSFAGSLASLSGLLGVRAFTYNIGHRLGGDLYPTKSENSLGTYSSLLNEHSHAPTFRYVELDVQETRDGEIVVFHDVAGGLSRLVADSEENRAALVRLEDRPLSEITIADLTLDEVRALTLTDGSTIPTLIEVLEHSADWGLEKRILIEVKRLHSDAARFRLLELAGRFRCYGRLAIDFLAFRRNFRRSFPDLARWRSEFRTRGFRVYLCGRPKWNFYNIC